MATGSTYDFEANRDQIIADALTNVGALGPGDSALEGQLTHGARALNRLVKALDPEGMYLWRSIRRTFNTTDGTASYSLAADVLAVDEPLSYKPASSNSRSLLTQISRDDYMSLTDRTSEGRPTQYWLERTLTTSTIYLWPTPDTTGDTIEYTAIVKSRDFDTAANTPDFPAHWTNCLVYGLTAELAPAYGQLEMAAYYTGLFDKEKERLLNSDSEKGRLTLVPWGAAY